MKFFKRYVYMCTQYVENILITAHKVKIKTNRISLLDVTSLGKAFKEVNIASYFPKGGFRTLRSYGFLRCICTKKQIYK